MRKSKTKTLLYCNLWQWLHSRAIHFISTVLRSVSPNIKSKHVDEFYYKKKLLKPSSFQEPKNKFAPNCCLFFFLQVFWIVVSSLGRLDKMCWLYTIHFPYYINGFAVLDAIQFNFFTRLVHLHYCWCNSASYTEEWSTFLYFYCLYLQLVTDFIW